MLLVAVTIGQKISFVAFGRYLLTPFLNQNCKGDMIDR